MVDAESTDFVRCDTTIVADAAQHAVRLTASQIGHGFPSREFDSTPPHSRAVFYVSDPPRLLT